MSDLETKHLNEISNLKNTHQLEVEYKIKEINILKNETDLLRNFEKEYIKNTRHEEILKNLREELNIKYMKDIKLKEDELEVIFKSRSIKFEEEKRIEHEFLIENLKKNIKKLEINYDESSKLITDLEEKLSKERENNEKLNELSESLKKNIKIVNSQAEDDLKIKRNQSEKINLYEGKINNLTNTNYNYQENLNNLINKLNYLEGEKKILSETVISKEENYKKDLEGLESKFSDYKEFHTEKYNEECKNHEKTKKLLTDLESSYKDFQREYSETSNKNNELNQQIGVFEELTQNLNTKVNILESENDKLERKLYESEKKFKRLLSDSKNFNDILLKIFKTKLNSIRNDANQIKNISLNEINLVKKEYSRKIEEAIAPKITLLYLNFEKQCENKIKTTKDTIIKEYQKKIDESQSEYLQEIEHTTQKYEKKISEISKLNERLEKEFSHIVFMN